MKGVAESAAAIAALASQISDRTLVEFIADGDKAALKLFYLRHSARVYFWQFGAMQNSSKGSHRLRPGS